MSRLKISFFVFLVSAVVFPGLCSGDIRIDITKTAFRKLSVAVADFSGRADLGKKAAGVINADLEFSGYFAPVSNRDFLRDAAASGLDFSQWRAVGAEYLVIGSVETEEGMLRVECRLFDVSSGRELIGRRYRGPEGQLRDMAHRFSDETVSFLTGERGIAQTKILFVSDSTGEKEIWMMDYDGHNPVRVTRENSMAIVPSWVPGAGGRKISFTSYRDNNPDFYLMDIATGRRERLLSFAGLNYNAAWAPDGRRAAVTLTKDGRADIYLVDAGGRVLKKLTNHPSVDCSPSWSPCGNYIAFNSGRMGGPHIFIMDASGANVRRLTSSGGNGSPQWSPGGDEILYTSRRGGKFDVFIIGTDGTGERQVSSGPGNNENASFSLDGRHIAYSSTRDGGKNIYVSGVDGSNERRLTFLGGNSEFPAWSYD